jgi:hypothetical protein
MAPHDDDEDPAQLPLLRSVLPDGYTAARGMIDQVFGPAAGSDDPHRAALHDWLSTLLAAEYFGEEPGDGDLPDGAATTPRLRGRRPGKEARAERRKRS